MHCYYCVILLLYIAHASAHLCLITPQQRGAFDISHSGSYTCFRHGAPCGRQLAETPKYTFAGGVPVFMKWQQNFNHYEVGYPGYMDIAIAPADDLTNFELLAVVQDEYVYAQDYHRNFTAVVVLPNKQCDHCVIRARYNAHKPGETTFYQCSDITVTKTASPQSSPALIPPPVDSDFKFIQKAFDLRDSSDLTSVPNLFLYGMSFDPFRQDLSHYVQIEPVTGYSKLVKSLNIGIGSGERFSTMTSSLHHFGHSRNTLDNVTFIMDAIAAVDNKRDITAYISHSGNLDNIARKIIVLSTGSGTITKKIDIPNIRNTPINSLLPDGKGNFIAFQIAKSRQPGSYIFSIKSIYQDGNVLPLFDTLVPENLYINFQWAEYVSKTQHLYVLLGNENAADALDAELWIFDLRNQVLVSKHRIDVTQYTFQSMQYYEATGKFYALSPGLFRDAVPAWHLINVYPNGTVVKVADIASPGIFQRYYGGTVFNGIDQMRGILVHVFRVAQSEADVIAYIDLNTGKVTYSQVTNLRHIHNLAMLPGTDPKPVIIG